MKKLVNKMFSKGKRSFTVNIPRSKDDIMKAYYELRGRAGEAQYQVYVFEQELKNLNAQLVNLNIEMTERQKLDKEKDAAEKPVKEAKTQE
jgi:hypothetical protein